MSGTILIGSQWGDEGKGRVVDMLANKADYVVRFQGGPNAGHTIVVGDNQYIFHLMPSGIVAGKQCAIASKVRMDPYIMWDEIRDVRTAGLDPKLHIDPRAGMIMPYHRWMDAAKEEMRSTKDKIGTTLRGMGPAYSDIRSDMVRFEDLCDPNKFVKKFRRLYDFNRKVIERVFEMDLVELVGKYSDLLDQDVSIEHIEEQMIELGKVLSPFLHDVAEETYFWMENGHVLFEGAQGTDLDVDYGSYPFVTGSNTISMNALVSAGVSATRADLINPMHKLDTIGIVKAYTTRVGGGPMRTKLKHDRGPGKHLGDKGHEFGATTGRRRDCGWLDLEQIARSNRRNGFTSLAITKLDVLCELPNLKIAVGTKSNGKPEYQDFEGFDFDPAGIRCFGDLPKEAQTYLRFIATEVRVPIRHVTFGPERTQAIETNVTPHP